MKQDVAEFAQSFTEKYFLSSPLKNEISKAIKLYAHSSEIDELKALLPIFSGNFEQKNGFPFYSDGAYPKEFFKKLCENAGKYGISVEKYSLAVYPLIFSEIKDIYKKFEIPSEIFASTEASLTTYIKSYISLTSIEGISSYRWCANYLCLAVFRIGEIEYQLCANPFDKGVLPEGFDFVIKIHIPEGCDFSDESRKVSYKSAYEFFSQKLCEKNLLFVCDSWLLSKEHKDIKGNISSFYNDFKIVSEYSDYEKDFLWRVFGTESLDDVATLPNFTTLQRFYIKKLKEKSPFYSSVGYFVVENAEDIWKK